MQTLNKTLGEKGKKRHREMEVGGQKPPSFQGSYLANYCLLTYNTRILQQCCLITDSQLNEIWCKQEAHAVKGEDFLPREDIKTEDMLGEGWSRWEHAWGPSKSLVMFVS